MDKNGTNRGGARTGAGRKPRTNIKFNMAETPTGRIKTPEILKNIPMAADIYKSIVTWFKKNNILEYVPPDMIILYAVTLARWQQAQTEINTQGMTTTNSKTGETKSNPNLKISIELAKQTTAVWWNISQTIKERSAGEMVPAEPTNDLITLLQKRQKAAESANN